MRGREIVVAALELHVGANRALTPLNAPIHRGSPLVAKIARPRDGGCGSRCEGGRIGRDNLKSESAMRCGQVVEPFQNTITRAEGTPAAAAHSIADAASPLMTLVAVPEQLAIRSSRYGCCVCDYELGG